MLEAVAMKIVFAEPPPRTERASVERRLAGLELRFLRDTNRLAEELADADAVVCHRLSAADMARADRLRLVQAVSAGADGIDRDALPADAVLCNTPGAGRAIAEWVVMAMLLLPREVLRFDRDLRRGVWHRFDDERLDLGEPELEGKTVAIVGFGDIGREVAGLSRALGARPLAFTRSPRDGALPLGELREVLAKADFGVVAIPLRPETRGLIGARELEALGPQAYLVNVARGEVVDEDALFAALRDRTIAGAALDVWYRYPRARGDVVQPSRHPFHELDNVLMTPHVSGRSRRTTERRWRFIADQLERFSRGERLQNVIR
jgi:phosphoglycerate dehydrogenase-like enzyme